MKEFHTLNEVGRHSSLHLQSSYNDIPEAAGEGDVEHSMEITTIQKEFNLTAEETPSTSTSVTSDEPSAKPSESSTAL